MRDAVRIKSSACASDLYSLDRGVVSTVNGIIISDMINQFYFGKDTVGIAFH
jgi:hypothetical protein